MRFIFYFFKVQCFPYFHDKTRSRVGSSALCWTEIPDQNMIMNLNILAATVRSFKMLIDYTLDLTPPISPCPLSLLQKKEKTRRRNCFKIPTSTASCGPCKHPKQILSSALGTNFLSFWLGSVSFSNLFLFSFPLPPMLLLKSSHQSQLSVSHASPWVKRASFWLA